MKNQDSKLKTLVQAGAIGLCILLIGLIYIIFTEYATLAEQSNAAIRDNTRALQRLNDLLENPMSANTLKRLSLHNIIKNYENKN